MTGAAVSGVQHQLRRGTNTQMNLFTGAQGEPTFDTTFGRLVMHDGVTLGGIAHAYANSSSSTAAATIGPTTAQFTSFSTSGIVITLPSLASYPNGQILAIMDGAGVGGSTTFTIVTASASDLIASSTTTGSTSYQPPGNNFWAIELIDGSSSRWILK